MVKYKFLKTQLPFLKDDTITTEQLYKEKYTDQDISRLLLNKRIEKIQNKDLPHTKLIEEIKTKNKLPGKQIQIPTRYIAQAFLEQNPNTFYIKETKEIFVYKEQEGIFTNEGDVKLQHFIQDTLEEQANNNKETLIIGEIRRTTIKTKKELKHETQKDNKNLLCCENGILNIKTKELIPHTPQKIFLSKTPIIYNSSATCTLIDKTLHQILLGNINAINTIYEYAGYILLDAHPIQKALLFVGERDNGKSTIIQLLSQLCSEDNIASISIQQMEEDRFATADLENAKLNVVPDMSAKDFKDISILKTITSGKDRITVQRKNQQSFRIISTAKNVISCNRLPSTENTDDAFYKRLIIIQFLKIFSKEEINPNLIDELIKPEELSGFLNKALEGLTNILQQKKFSLDRTTEEVKILYENINDSITGFIEECINHNLPQKDDPQLDFIPSDTLMMVQTLYSRCKGLTPASSPKKLLPRILNEVANSLKGRHVDRFTGEQCRGIENIAFIGHFTEKVWNSFEPGGNRDLLENYIKPPKKVMEKRDVLVATYMRKQVASVCGDFGIDKNIINLTLPLQIGGNQDNVATKKSPNLPINATILPLATSFTIKLNKDSSNSIKAGNKVESDVATGNSSGNVGGNLLPLENNELSQQEQILQQISLVGKDGAYKEQIISQFGKELVEKLLRDGIIMESPSDWLKIV